MNRKSKSEVNENAKNTDFTDDLFGLTDDERDALMRQLIQSGIFGGTGAMEEITEKNAKTSSDFIILANQSEDEKTALKYARKAKKLDPDNLDADEIIIGITAKNAFDAMTMYKEAAAHGAETMKKQGFDTKDDIGNYWMISETRPYMRTLNSYMHSLISCGMFGEAIKTGKEMLRLCEGDNLGVRYNLMHLYAFFEDEESALALWKQFEEYDCDQDSQFLMPFSILHFKKGNTEKAAEYLNKLAAVNKDTKIFIKMLLKGSIEEANMNALNLFGYHPYTIDELLMMLASNVFLYSEMPAYFEWANEILKPKRKPSAAASEADEKKTVKKTAAKKKTAKKTGDNK